MNTPNNICFAYFSDNKFLGWYSGTFGGVSKNPKVYTNTPEQIETIKNNLSYKLKKINSSTLEQELSKAEGLQTIGLLCYSSEEFLRGRQIELRIVECPFYDGINPAFDKDKYKAEYEDWVNRATEAGVIRTPEILQWQETNKRPVCDNWIYCDYTKVKAWAANEPTEFLGVINPTIS